MAELVFGRVPKPPIVERFIPDSQTGAWNYLGPRKVLGVCQHSMVGGQISTDRWFRNGVPSPTHIAQGLTDYGIGNSTDGPELDGVIWQWNDPFGGAHPGVSANRAGWASGGSDGLEGDGPMFVRTLGVNAINRDLASIERSDGGNINTPMSPKQFESICALTAWLFDQAKVPWDQFPFNPHTGCVTHMLHFEFATKACPFDPIRSNIQVIQDKVRAILKQYQTEVAQPAPSPEPVPDPNPTPQPKPEWPNGWTTAELTKQFGKITQIDTRGGYDDIKTKQLVFDKNGPISNAWVQRCVKAGITKVSRMPKPGEILVTQSRDGYQATLVIFPRSGYADWVMFKGDGNSSWIWLQ